MDTRYCKNVDPVYYSSEVRTFYLVETGIQSVRNFLENPVRTSCYVRDVHQNPVYGQDRHPLEFSLFVQLIQSDWTFFNLYDILYKTFKHVKKKREDKRIAVAASLSAIFHTRALIFGYGDFGDSVYYDMFDQGFHKETFCDHLESDSAFFTSTERPAFKPQQRKIAFIEETFQQWNIFIPWAELYFDTKESQLLRGGFVEESIFSEHEIQGFDCALLNYLCL
ncbi:MAG: hypothetical protein D3921_07330 [Candidatus Electrothrix sp. AW1]|nr:hypothetical protein [Candidatus Electrothrix sp. AX1]MCI5182316.1 hypothetical protein [Candidatus Electrothrix gigas]